MLAVNPCWRYLHLNPSYTNIAWRHGIEMENAIAMAMLWLHVLALRLQHQQLQPDVMTYSAAISACEEGSRWLRAIDLLKKMDRDSWNRYFYLGTL